MRKQILSICLVIAMLLALGIPTVAAEDAVPDYDALAVAEGYQARVGEAEEAFDNGNFTGYFKFESGGSDATLDYSGGKVPVGSTVTLITDVTVNKEMYIRNRFTLDGNGKTLYGMFRSADDCEVMTDITVRNLTIRTTLVNGGGGTMRYIYQINDGHRAVFENCTFEADGIPQFTLFVVRGDLTLRNSTVNFTPSDLSQTRTGFLIDQATGKLTLENTAVNIATEASMVTPVQLSGASILTIRGNTTVKGGNGSGVVVSNANAVINIDSTVTAEDVPMSLPVDFQTNVVSVWDGTSVDTSWLDPANLQASYEIDSAAKLAGLAKLCHDKATAAFPSGADGDLITFYLTADIDLAGQEWLPIGDSYATRFAGNLIGKKNGVAGVAVTVRGLNVNASGDNAGFIGTADRGGKFANLIFTDSVVKSEHNTVGTVIGYARGGATLENITVTGARVESKGSKWVGGIVAYAKSGNLVMTGCVFDGAIVANGGNMIGGLVGNSVVGATVKNCYVGGTIAATNTKDVGGILGYLDAKGILDVSDSQLDGYLLNSGSLAGTGALVGRATAGEGSAVKMTSVLVSGISIETPATAAGFALIGIADGSGALSLTADHCVSLTKAAVIGTKADTVTATGTDSGFTSAKADEVAGDLGKTLLGGTAWTARTKMYPILSVANGLYSNVYGTADYSWFDLGTDTMEIANANELVGLSVLSKLCNFEGKTVKLTADISGEGLPKTAKLGLGGSLGNEIKTGFVGTFDKNNHSITQLIFDIAGPVVYVVTWDLDDGSEPIREEYGYKEMPVFKGSTERADDEVYQYTFRGWDQEITEVTTDITYTARWKKTRLKELNTEEVTTEAPSDETQAPSGTDAVETPEEKKGCSSAISGWIFPVCTVLALVALILPTVTKKSRAQR